MKLNGGNTKMSFPALTGLRAIAAFLVFIHHHHITGIKFAEFNFQRELHVGVSIFFVLSGFLIGYRYYEIPKLNFSWLKTYVVNRFARIYPVYFLLLIPVLLYDPAHQKIGSWILNITLLKGFFNKYKMSGIAQAWSLTVEFCFYFTAPFLLYYFKQKLKIPLIAFFLILPSVILIGYLLHWNSLLSPAKFILIYTFFGRFLEFFAGIFLARIIIAPSNHFMQRIKYGTYTGTAGIILVICLLTLLQSGEYWNGLFHPIGIFLNNVVLPLFVLLMIYGLIREDTILQKFLSTRTMDLLGKSSYAFYLIHHGFIAAFFFSHFNYIVSFVMLIIISIAIFYLIEEPLHKQIRKL